MPIHDEYQIIALSTSWWASFTARTDLGKPEENGHYGLWTLCSTKGPHWKEDCDPLDTFFEAPPYSVVSAILAGFHILFLVIFLPLGILRTLQVFNNSASYCLNPKKLRIIQISLLLCSVFLAILVPTFASIGEYDKKEYLIVKGWSFWIQAFIIVLDVTTFALCIAELIKFLKFKRQQEVDPEGNRAETYGNPSFDADSPEMRRSRNHSNGGIAITESSGHPYEMNPPSGENTKDLPLQGKPIKLEKDAFQTLTYENDCYLESSPRAGRRQLSSLY